MDWLDQYEIRARIAPTFVMLLPLILALLFVVLGLFGAVPASLGSLGGVAVLALIVSYAFSFWPQHLGKEKQDELWVKWGGAPTTRMLRWRDRTLDRETKRRMRARAQQVSGVTLLSEKEEEKAPEEADERIEQAVDRVREVMRREDTDGLWSRHNAEYGFCRNLLGGRVLWVASPVLGALVCAGFWYFHEKNGFFVAGFVSSVAFVVIALVSGWYLLPRFTEKAADRYAKSMLGSFLAHSDGEAR
ncbi:MAG: hypothetical protein CYG60_17185 [Actinobacteria bacterium]|nr:MAG: hypothetical protein CYG60_17185 [Actinomycetota bacterium]